jgi:hypothetical protein
MEKLMNWLGKNGWGEVLVMKDPDGFMYDMSEQIISLGIYEEPDTDEYFKEFLTQHGCTYADECPAPMLAFLHELGHHNTIYDFDHFDLVLSSFIKDSLSDDDGMTEREKVFTYWETPDEYAANMWEIEYLMNEDNFPAIEELFDILKEIYA